MKVLFYSHNAGISILLRTARLLMVPKMGMRGATPTAMYRLIRCVGGIPTCSLSYKASRVGEIGRAQLDVSILLMGGEPGTSQDERPGGPVQKS